MEQNLNRTGKGKGKEASNCGRDPTITDQPSMASRIAASASGLVRDMVGVSGTSDVPTSLASASGLAQKSQGSSLSAERSTWAESRTSVSSPGNSMYTSSLSGSESFRTVTSGTTEDTHVAEFLQAPSIADSQGYTTGSASPWSHEFTSLPERRFLGSSGEPRSRGTNVMPLAGGPVQYDDGAAVRYLLSNPAFDTEDDPLKLETHQLADESTAMDLFGGTLSEEELAAAKWMKSSLPEPAVHQGIPLENALSLVPDSWSVEASNLQHLLSEWDSVLNHYTDEVWGEMLPAVQVARAEIQEVKAGTQPPDSKAVMRLRMILGHVVHNAPLSVAAPTPATQHGSGEPNKDSNTPTFRCPWRSCHQRFNTLMDLRMHSSIHKPLNCPHSHCVANFSLDDEWREHIMLAHHDLLATGTRREEITA